MSERIVVLGSNGQLGRALQKTLPTALFLSRLYLDLMKPSWVIKDYLLNLRPMFIINCAGYTDVDKAEVEADKATHLNADVVGVLAQSARELNAHLIHVSSDYVFNPESRVDHEESEAPSPQSVYGRSKMMGEMLALTAGQVTVVRTSWLFGDGRNFVKKVLSKSRESYEIEVVTDQIGRPTSAYDLAKAISQLVSLKELGRLPHDLKFLHIQNEGPVVSWATYANIILKLANAQTTVNRVSSDEYTEFAVGLGRSVASRPKYSVFNLSLMHSLGIRMPDWRTSLKKYIQTCKL